MGTAKVTQQGDTFTIENPDGEVHTGIPLDETAELLDVDEEDVISAIQNGEGGVGLISVGFDEGEEDELEEEVEEDEDDE